MPIQQRWLNAADYCVISPIAYVEVIKASMPDQLSPGLRFQ